MEGGWTRIGKEVSRLLTSRRCQNACTGVQRAGFLGAGDMGEVMEGKEDSGKRKDPNNSSGVRKREMRWRGGERGTEGGDGGWCALRVVCLRVPFKDTSPKAKYQKGAAEVPRSYGANLQAGGSAADLVEGGLALGFVPKALELDLVSPKAAQKSSTLSTC